MISPYTTIRLGTKEYYVECELGRSALSIVWKGQNQETDGSKSFVALKELKLDDSDDGIRNFLVGLAVREDRIHAMLRAGLPRYKENGAPSFLNVMTHAVVQGASRVYVFPYIEGITLVQAAQAIPSEKMHELKTTDARFRFIVSLLAMSDAAKGLSFLHSRNYREGEKLVSLVHRDVKLDNIMLTAAARGVLIDYGIAKTSIEDEDPTFSIGTAQFMSPEQVFGERLQTASDMYSFGASLFYLLTTHHHLGINPEHSAHVGDVALQGAFFKTPSTLKKHIPDAPHELETLISCLLEKKPKNRPTAHYAATQLTAFAERACKEYTLDISKIQSWLASIFPKRTHSEQVTFAQELPAETAASANINRIEGDVNVSTS